MNLFLHPRWRVVLGVLFLIWLVFLAGIGLSGFHQTYPLPVSEIRYDAGCAYKIDLHHRPVGWPITTFVSDTMSASTASNLLLFEDSKPLEMPHTLHDEIRRNGLGNYSHWDGSLYFSASDCSDPRSNGRRYIATAPLDLSMWAHASWLLAFICFGRIVRNCIPPYKPVQRLFDFTRYTSNAAFSPIDFQHRSLQGLGIFLLIVLGAGSFLFGVWSAGTSINVTAAGFYQGSDALGYWVCSNAFVDDGTFGNPKSTGEWCQRRAIYSIWLSGIGLLGGRNIFGILLLQALLVSFAIYIFIRRSSLYIGALGAALCTVLLFKYATANVFSQTMTANAGLIFGCVGFASLLKASGKKSLTGVVSGIAMVSIALNARTGAFFILPCLVFWAGIAANFFRQRVWRWVVAAFMATLAGFALQAVLVLAIGGSSSNSHGNFAHTLYGLSVGGKGWAQVYKDHPEFSEVSDSAANKAIYALAWDNLIAQPVLFLQGLSKNISIFLSIGTYDYKILGRWGDPIKFCWWLAWIPLLLNYRNPAYLMIALSSLGVVSSAPFLMVDGGGRIFAASVVIDVMQIGVGVYFTGRLLQQGLEGFLPLKLEQAGGRSGGVIWGQLSFELLAGMLFLSVLFIPYTPLRHFQAQTKVEVTGCQEGEDKVATRIGKGGTIVLDLVSDSQKADFLRGEISRKDFVDGIPRWAWWRDGLVAFDGVSLLSAYQLAVNDPKAPGPYHVYSDQHLAKYHGSLVRLCTDKKEKIELFGNPYSKLNSISILE